MLRASFLFYALIIPIVHLSITSQCNGDILMTITDDGTDLTMRATGTYDVSAASPSVAPAIGANAAVSLGVYGWETGSSPDGYLAAFSGSLSGNPSLLGATSVTTNTPFYFANVGAGLNSIVFASGTSTTGTVDETAVFAGTTLADLGMVTGETVTVTWAGDSAIITTATVPEPSSLLMFGFGLTALVCKRRRR